MAEDNMYIEGWCNLHYAVAGRFTKLILSLLEQEGKEIVNKKDGQGRTALHLACSHIQQPDIHPFPKALSDTKFRPEPEVEEIIELLLTHGADPQILDNKGKSPLHCLVDDWFEKQYPLEDFGRIISQFLCCSGNINVKDGNGRTVLHYVAGSSELQVPEVNKYEAISNSAGLQNPRRIILPVIETQGRMLQEESQKNAPRDDDLTENAAENELLWKELLVKLLSCGADMNVVDKNGNTPLHLAIVANKHQIVNELLKGKSNLNIQNNFGQTPLHLTVADIGIKTNNYAILMMYKGALASIRDAKGRTPIDLYRGLGGSPLSLLKHVILLINIQMHPEMHFNVNTNIQREILNEYRQECKDLNIYLENQDISELPTIVRYHSIPIYTNNDFLQKKIKCDNFTKLFPSYSYSLEKKFSQDQKRMEMINKSTGVFSYCGVSFHFTSAGRLDYKQNYHWEMLPTEIKLKILSYLSNEELEFLEKHL